MTATGQRERTAGPERAERAATGGRGVVEGSFALLEALRRCGGEAGVTELALACALSKGTAHRLLTQLQAVGAVERSGRRYRLGPLLYRLGQAWQPYPGLRAAAALPLRRLRDLTGASVVLTVLRDRAAFTVSSVPGEVESLAPVSDGVAFSLDTAAGRALRGAAGVSLEREEVVEGVCCAALPVRAPRGRTVAAVAAMVPVGSRLDAVARAVAQAGGAITQQLARGAAPHGGQADTGARPSFRSVERA